MKFGAVPVAEAAGSIAAHSVRAGEAVIRKGATVTEEDVARLQAAGVAEIVAVRLEAGDIGENVAAERLARALAGAGIRLESPFTGRVNLFAEAAGVLAVDAAALDRFNGIDEAITAATLPAQKGVVAGEMVGTVKIIPYGVRESLVDEAAAAVAGRGVIALSPYRARKVHVISTLLPGLKPSVVDKTLKVMAERLHPSGSAIAADARVPHRAAPLAEAIAEAAPGEAEMIVVFGASAITDRRDVIPQALLAAGGRIEHLGMPVDPGNLLLVGEIGGKPVLGAPGCARSPKENGFDWVLQRLLADIPVRRRDIQAMGVGGLLMEIVSRPQPRAPGHGEARSGAAPAVAGIVLAAGRSTRMGGPNKLLEPIDGKPMVRLAAEAQLAAGLAPVVVVTGHEAAAVEEALSGLGVAIVVNADHAAGLSTSIRTGVAALPAGVAGAVVSLGDMPDVSAVLIRRLVEVFADRPEAEAVVPTLLGQRGNPVLLARPLFAAVAALSGDQGARRLLDAGGEGIVEVPVDDPAIALDLDTPQALAAFRAQRRQ